MRKGIFSLIFPVLFATLLYTEVVTAAWDIEPAVDIGNRDAEFQWSIAGRSDGTDPNIISELTWRNLTIQEFNASLVAKWNDNLVLRGYWNDGDVTGGDNQDSDYAFDNRQGEFSRSNNQGNSGSTHDNSIGVGMPIRFPLNQSWQLTLSPMFGFSYHEQNLRMKNGLQTVSNPVLADNEGFIDHTDPCYLIRNDPADCMPAVGDRFTNLNSTYETEWKDSWFGADLLWEWGKRTRFTTKFEYHIADYYAHANWNLRSDLAHPVSYEQWANGTGIVIGLGWETVVYKSLLLGVNVDWQKWTTDTGVARFYDLNYNPGFVTLINTQFNGAEWRSSAIFFHVGFQFNSL